MPEPVPLDSAATAARPESAPRTTRLLRNTGTELKAPGRAFSEIYAAPGLASGAF